MGKDKLRRFRENTDFDCFVQPEFDEVFHCDHPLKGRWRSDFFRNDNPIVLELGCGKGEYTVALAEHDPWRNYIGIDIKGARMRQRRKERQPSGRSPMRASCARAWSSSTACSPKARWTKSGSPFPIRSSKAAGPRSVSPRRCSSEYYARLLKPDGMDQPQDRLETPVRLHQRGRSPLLPSLRGFEPRHLRFGVCRRGAFGQNGLRETFSRNGSSDHLYPLFAGRTAGIPVVRLGRGRKGGKGQRAGATDTLTPLPA